MSTGSESPESSTQHPDEVLSDDRAHHTPNENSSFASLPSQDTSRSSALYLLIGGVIFSDWCVPDFILEVFSILGSQEYGCKSCHSHEGACQEAF